MSGMVRGPFREMAPDLRIAGVVDPDEEGARSRLDDCDKDVRFYKTIGQLVRSAKPDALAIGTRCNLHSPIAVKAARYGLPLFLEKPVAITLRQAVALERAYENADCPVVVSFPLRVCSLFEEAHNQILRGAVGKPQHIMADNYVNYGRVYWEQGYRYWDITRGLFMQKATHDFDYIIKLMGQRITRVAAMATRGHIFGGTKPAGLHCSACDEAATCPESPQNREPLELPFTDDHPCTFSVDCGSPETGTNEDSSSCVFEFEDGAHGIYTQVFYTLRDAHRRGAVISGYEGTLSFDLFKPGVQVVKHFEAKTETIASAMEDDEHFGGDSALARNFIDVIQGRDISKSTLADGLQSVYTCLAATRSSQTGRFVPVRQVGQ